MDHNLPKYGQMICMAKYHSGKPCKNGAYFQVNENDKVIYVCGVHSKKNDNRVKLQKFTQGEKDENKQMAFDTMCSLAKEQASKNLEREDKKAVSVSLEWLA